MYLVTWTCTEASAGLTVCTFSGIYGKNQAAFCWQYENVKGCSVTLEVATWLLRGDSEVVSPDCKNFGTLRRVTAIYVSICYSDLAKQSPISKSCKTDWSLSRGCVGARAAKRGWLKRFTVVRRDVLIENQRPCCAGLIKLLSSVRRRPIGVFKF